MPSRRGASSSSPAWPGGRRLAALAGAGCVALFVALPVVFSDEFQPWKAELDYLHPFGTTTAIDPTNPGALALHTIVGHYDGVNHHSLVTTVMTDTISFDSPTPQRGPELVMNACCAPRHSLLISGVGGGFPVNGSDGKGGVTTYWVQYGPQGEQPTVSLLDPLLADTLYTSHHITVTRQTVVTHSTATNTLQIYRAPVTIDPTFDFVEVEVPADGPNYAPHWDGVLRGNDLWLLAPFAGNVWLYEINLDDAVVDSSRPLGKSSSDLVAGFYYAEITLCADGKTLAGVFPDPDDHALTVFMSDVHASTYITDTIPVEPSQDAQAVVCNGDILALHGAVVGNGVQDLWVNFGSLPAQTQIFSDTLRDVDHASVFESSQPFTLTRGVPIVEIDYDESGVMAGQGVVRHGWLSIPLFFDNFESRDLSFWGKSAP